MRVCEAGGNAMSLSRRFSMHFLRAFIAAALAAGAVLPAASQPIRGHEITFTSPQFVATAVKFKANDETGWYWTGSDEVYAVFSDMDPTHYDRVTSVYGDVDEGETKTFRAADRCMGPQPACDRGTSGLNLRFSFWERDALPLGLEWCNGDIPGSHSRLLEGCTSDDLIGHGSIIVSQEDLVAALPTVGAAREYTVSPTGGSGKYRFTYRITRLADVERTIAIHLPPDLGTTPTITLDAVVVSAMRVRLTWSGATTSTVDIYRNGVKVTTTANDGDHVDAVASGTYQYRVCNLGSTTTCSAQVTVVVT
jgi:hypothetical protein